MSGAFTPNPAPEGQRPAGRLITTLPSGKPWLYSGCEHHLREFVAGSREIGDPQPFWLFDASDDVFCPVCWAFAEGRKVPTFLFNQVPREELA